MKGDQAHNKQSRRNKQVTAFQRRMDGLQTEDSGVSTVGHSLNQAFHVEPNWCSFSASTQEVGGWQVPFKTRLDQVLMTHLSFISIYKHFLKKTLARKWQHQSDIKICMKRFNKQENKWLFFSLSFSHLFHLRLFGLKLWTKPQSLLFQTFYFSGGSNQLFHDSFSHFTSITRPLPNSDTDSALLTIKG